MPSWRFWERKQEPPAPSPEAAPLPASGLRLPPPRDRAPAGDPATRDKLAALCRRREGMRYDLERAEAAHRPDNPWRQRIALLDESLGTIEADLVRQEAIRPLPGFPLPPVPIEEVTVEPADPLAVSFRIGPERFRFSEESDWDQRGGPVVRGDLRLREGDAAALVPTTTPPDRRDALASHLAESVIVFATDLRDRAVDGEPPLPPERRQPTLTDLAEPCEVCGGWREWGGTCETCAARAYQAQLLNAEAVRLA
nr:hypothetical protein [Chloroflexia bacterium]